MPKIADRSLSSLIRSRIGLKSGIPGTRSGKFMGHNPFSREKGYVPNFPVMSRNSVLFLSAILGLYSILEFLADLMYFIRDMRLNKNQIEHLAFLILRNMKKEGKVLIEDKSSLLNEMISLITEEFQKEDQLDQEVRELLSKHMEKIRKDNLEYQTMFRMIKTKLAKERNIVL
jgi:hypothetical protein